MIVELILFEDNVIDEMLYEEAEKKLTHLNHLEDLIITHGSQGLDKVVKTALHTHEYLKGKKPSGFSLQTKFDGYLSVIFGHHPQTKKFFVGTKSFFNKTPKVNYTDKDVDTNHTGSESLRNKLKFLLNHLKKVSPKQGVFQGDLMYTSDEIAQDGSKLSFTPNTLTYNVDKNSHEGQKILKSKIGMAVHTHYEQGKNDNLEAVFDVNHNEFNHHDDIHFLPTKLRGPFNYRGEDQSAFNGHLSKAIDTHKSLENDIKKGEFGSTLKSHQKTLLSYINHTVRSRTNPNFAGYVSYLYNRAAKASEKSIKPVLSKEVQNIQQHKGSFEKLFQTHKHIQNAKNVLIHTLSKNSPYNETILGKPSKPEGFVASVDGHPIKLVDRQHFSAANFDWNEKVNPSDNPLVLHWGRFNPGTAGHEKMINKGADIARRIGAKQKVVATRSQDSKNNPLSPTQKLSWLKTMFPGQDVAIAGENEPTIIAQLQHLHNSGVKDLTMVVGNDRVNDFQKVLAKYNGDGKLFNFRRARVVSAGNRDPDSDDNEESISASKMRKAAKENDYKTFHSGLPKHLQGQHDKAQELFHDLQKQMKTAKISSLTNSSALKTYSKNKDKLGKDALKEIERRKRLGIWKE